MTKVVDFRLLLIPFRRVFIKKINQDSNCDCHSNDGPSEVNVALKSPVLTHECLTLMIGSSVSSSK